MLIKINQSKRLIFGKYKSLVIEAFMTSTIAHDFSNRIGRITTRGEEKANLHEWKGKDDDDQQAKQRHTQPVVGRLKTGQF